MVVAISDERHVTVGDVDVAISGKRHEPVVIWLWLFQVHNVGPVVMYPS